MGIECEDNIFVIFIITFMYLFQENKTDVLLLNVQ